MSLKRDLLVLTLLVAALLLVPSLPVTMPVTGQTVQTFSMTPSTQKLSVDRGLSGSFTVKIVNNGTTNLTLDLNATGELAKVAKFSNKSVTLTPGANITIKVTVAPDKWIGTGDHDLTISAANRSAPTDKVELLMPVHVRLPKNQSPNVGYFFLALLPLIIVLIGIAVFKQSGTTMAFVGLLACIILAVAAFKTPLDTTLRASVYGFIKSFGVSVAVIVTMFMVFLMGEMGLLKIISAAVKKLIVGKENMALFMGVGFGSFLTCLGVVTPALFPPVLVAMGFAPAAAVAIAVLGYNATTSFALLSIPITLPAEAGKLDPILFAYKISLFLPVISVGIALTILWMVGGKKSIIKGFPAALVSGLALAFACLGFSYIDLKAGSQVIPLSLIGVLAGLISMGALVIYQKIVPPKPDTDEEKEKKEKDKKSKNDKDAKEPVYTKQQIIRAFSPWIILTILATIVSIPAVGKVLKALPGSAEIIKIWDNKPIDLDVFNQIYFWIFIAILISIVVLRPTKEQLTKTSKTWLKRMWSPFLAYSIYFCISYVMAFSTMTTISGNILAPTSATEFAQYNMNNILGATLAAVFGIGFIFVAPTLGLFGAVVGGSETGSNVMFLGIQQKASVNIGLKFDQFMTLYGAHAAAGGIASAITPAKINNATATIGETSKLEAQIMRKHLAIAVLLTIVVSIMTAAFVSVGL
jgi:lactate permease